MATELTETRLAVPSLRLGFPSFRAFTIDGQFERHEIVEKERRRRDRFIQGESDRDARIPADPRKKDTNPRLSSTS